MPLSVEDDHSPSTCQAKRDRRESAGFPAGVASGAATDRGLAPLTPRGGCYDCGVRALRVAFLIPYGEPDEGFFPDTLPMVLAARAEALGHHVAAVRVYYDGHDAAADSAVRARLETWLAAEAPDLVVTERLFDPVPLERERARRPAMRTVLVSWGDAAGAPGVDLVLGAHAGAARHGRTRRSPSAGELASAFEKLLGALGGEGSLDAVPGLFFTDAEGRQHVGPAAVPAPLPRPFSARVDWDVIAPEGVSLPPRTRVFLFGNAGCPYARDPALEPHYAGVDLDVPGLSRLGCAFCPAGGDYQKRADADVVEEVLAQAAFFARAFPEATERVIIDQRPERYLAALVRGAARNGLPPGRWLFPARADAFVREQSHIAEAARAAAETGQQIEVYLSGFESFSDAELRRYNKGVTAGDLVRAVEVMRDLARAHPLAFDYRRARGHSLVLWSPWTTPGDLRATVEAVRAHGLGELFDDLGKNRLRLYPHLPITLAAERDGAVVDAWEEGDEGAGREKGYAVEMPWRFLDARTRLAHGLARMLRETLGPQTEVAQLAAAVDRAERFEGAADDVPALVDRVRGEIGALREVLAEMGRTGEGHVARGDRLARAAVVRFTGACNNGCRSCPNRTVYMPDDAVSLEARIDEARAQGKPLVLAGREATLHPSFMALVRRAAGDDARPVAVVTNGRRFSIAVFTRAAVAAGLSGASIKLFAPDAARADAITRDPGAHAQAVAGARALRGAGIDALEVRVPVHARTLDVLDAYIPLAVDLGVRRLRIDVGLDALGLDALGRVPGALRRLATRASAASLALRASPLEAGAVFFDEAPVG